MSKKAIVGLLAASGCVLGGAAHATPTAASLLCAPPVIQTAAADAKAEAQFTIECSSGSAGVITPGVRFAGEVPQHGTPPYAIAAKYTVDARSTYQTKMGVPPRLDQLAVGLLKSNTDSVATLPTQFAQQMVWDSKSSTLSVEETTGNWHVFSMHFNPKNSDEAYLIDAGFASTPVEHSKASLKVVFGPDVSRFASVEGQMPGVNAILGLREGKLEIMPGFTQAEGQRTVQKALQQLDRKPKDISRAWSLAAIAKFLGLDAEVRYAEQKVAAHNPQLLEEFQVNLNRIAPFTINK